jgi:FkbH-like protein
MSGDPKVSAPAQRIAVLCSFNLDLIQRPLQKALSAAGLSAELYLSGYGQWQADALDPESKLHRFGPSLTFLFLDAEDELPSLTPDGALPTLEGAEPRGRAAWSRAEGAIQTLLARLPGPVVCHTMVAPPGSALGLLEGNGGYSHAEAIGTFNGALRAFAAREPRVQVFNYDALVLEHGHARWHDSRVWHLGRMRLASPSLPLLAAAWARHLAALYNPRRKCLVLDLDNTLWGGVLGEDGPGGIQLGHSGIGLAYREFQMAALALASRGVLLAAASKNNVDDVLPVLRDHPDMVLRPEHFACLEIHWQDKPESLRRIAEKLNIGRDSLVFWDDNPLERGMVKSQLPEVLVPEVPEDPSEYAQFLRGLTCFDALTLTKEDRSRGKMYREQVERESFLAQGTPQSLDDYYASLEMVATIEPATETSIPRIAQLTQRTNQLNLTTRRYTEADLRARAADPSCRVYGLSLRDRFGDLGLIGAAVLQEREGEWELDTFLMSCRALGRRVEEAFATHLAEVAAQTGKPLRGVFLPTKKNAPMRELLERNGWLVEDAGAPQARRPAVVPARPGEPEGHPVVVTALPRPSFLRVVVVS